MKGSLLFLPFLLLLSSVAAQQCVFEGLREAYYPFKVFNVAPIYSTIGMPNHDWKFAPPNEHVGADYYSARWDGTLTFPEAGTYSFRTGSDDGIRVFLNGAKLCEYFDIRPYKTNICGSIDVTAGQKVPVVVEYFEMINSAKVTFEWKGPGIADYTPVPQSAASFSNCISAAIIAQATPIDPSTGFGSITVKLSKSPATNVTIELGSDCYSLSDCLLTFTPSNWDVPQTVRVQANLQTTAECCPVNLTATDGDSEFVGKSASVVICKKFPRPSFAYSYGDPHLKTFDGVKYDFFDIGDFYFLRQLNSELVIQERQERCAEASCNYALAIKYKSAVFYLYVTREGVPSSSLVGSLSAEGVTVTGGGDQFLFYLPDGVLVSASVGLWKERKVYYLAVQVTANSPQHGQYLGLAGYFDGNAANDYSLPDKSVTTDRLTFARSWKVPDAENLFLNAQAVIPPYPGSSPTPAALSTCAVQPPLPGTITDVIKNDTSSPLEENPVPDDPDYEPIEDCQVFTDPAKEAAAVAACSPPFNNSAAECCSKLGVSGDSFFATCLCDFNLIGSDDFVDDTVNAFYHECELAAAAAETDCNTCPSGCSGHGDCVQGSCHCWPGFQGDSCSEDWENPPTISSVIPLAIYLDCTPGPTTLTLRGENFYGTDLSCLFGLVKVPATKISNFQLTCPLPSGLTGDSVDLKVVRGEEVSQAYLLSLVHESCCSQPCQNGGVCSDTSTGFSCDCTATDFIGDRCEGLPQQEEPTTGPTNPPPSSCASETENGATIPETFSGESGKYTCPPGSHLQVERYCCGVEFTGKKISCVPYSLSCPYDLYENALWPKTYAGLPAFGICLDGFQGEPRRVCGADGHWEDDVEGACVGIPTFDCEAVKEDNAQWFKTAPGGVAQGQCLLGYEGSPTRLCYSNGTFGPIEDPCTQVVTCDSLSGENGEFPVTNAGDVATSECPEGYSGQISRECLDDGTWGEPQNTCVPARCEEVTEGNITWPATNPGQISQGICLEEGKGGEPTRPCLADGTFGEISGGCTACPPEFYGRATWPSTPGGELALGVCKPGWTGTPFRECGADGVWASYLSKLCDRLYCPPVSDEVHLFEEMEAGTQHYGKCLQGTGRPWRKCNIDGTHGPIQNPCEL